MPQPFPECIKWNLGKSLRGELVPYVKPSKQHIVWDVEKVDDGGHAKRSCSIAVVFSLYPFPEVVSPGVV